MRKKSSAPAAAAPTSNKVAAAPAGAEGVGGGEGDAAIRRDAAADADSPQLLATANSTLGSNPNEEDPEKYRPQYMAG